jgi:2-oxoglutarate ferredoxin oxidoreductase subunit alpha
MREGLELLEEEGVRLDELRVRAFPFHDDVKAFISRHDRVFIVEQNRDAQLRTLIVNECGIDPARLVPILHYDGTPVTARFISAAVRDKAVATGAVPLRKVAS